jgi:hypothetical protein
MYMQGSVSASQDEIAWVLTSYIAAVRVRGCSRGMSASPPKATWTPLLRLRAAHYHTVAHERRCAPQQR